jgi:hypothetical protein
MMTNREYCDMVLSNGGSLNYEAFIKKAECGTLVATHATHTLEEAERLASRYNKMNGLTANINIKVSL